MPIRIPSFLSAGLALALAACHAVKSPPVTATAHVTAPLVVAEQVAVRKTTVQRLNFKVDAGRSTGLLATTLDPHFLGPRHSVCRCPLRGTVSGKLTTHPDGTRTLVFDSIALATTRDGHLLYDWSILVGTIESVIPAGILTIRQNTLPGPISVEADGNFTHPGNHFTVGGYAEVKGNGLILKKQVGESREDLTIRKTEPVHLAGSLVQRDRDGAWVLHVPSAVMVDRFEIDNEGSTLDLHFTADITAVAQ